MHVLFRPDSIKCSLSMAMIWNRENSGQPKDYKTWWVFLRQRNFKWPSLSLLRGVHYDEGTVICHLLTNHINCIPSQTFQISSELFPLTTIITRPPGCINRATSYRHPGQILMATLNKLKLMSTYHTLYTNILSTHTTPAHSGARYLYTESYFTVTLTLSTKCTSFKVMHNYIVI